VWRDTYFSDVSLNHSAGPTSSASSTCSPVQLPDALRRVCRSVVLQPIDATVAAEAGLRSVGIAGATALARELVAILSLTAEHRAGIVADDFVGGSVRALVRSLRLQVRRMATATADVEEMLECLSPESLGAVVRYDLPSLTKRCVV